MTNSNTFDRVSCTPKVPYLRRRRKNYLIEYILIV